MLPLHLVAGGTREHGPLLDCREELAAARAGVGVGLGGGQLGEGRHGEEVVVTPREVRRRDQREPAAAALHRQLAVLGAALRTQVPGAHRLYTDTSSNAALTPQWRSSSPPPDLSTPDDTGRGPDLLHPRPGRGQRGRGSPF